MLRDSLKVSSGKRNIRYARMNNMKEVLWP